MYKIVDGVKMEMTPEEVAEFERTMASIPDSPPTSEERIAALESAMLAMMGGKANV